MLTITYTFLVFCDYGGLSGTPINFFVPTLSSYFVLNWKKSWVYAAFIHVFIPLISYLSLSEKIFYSFCAIFFAKTEDALAK